MHEAIFSIVVPGSIADERCRFEIFNSVRFLDDLQKALKKSFNLTKTATYYRLLPANVRHKDGMKHVHTRSCEALPSSK